MSRLAFLRAEFVARDLISHFVTASPEEKREVLLCPKSAFPISSLNGPNPLTYARAKRMRREPTAAERKLWGALRNRSLGGFKFYRQVPVGPYIVDFINHEFGVVIEVDGATHGDTDEVARDEKRTAFLQAKGLYVHRVGNLDVYENLIGVCDSILLVLEERATRDLIRPVGAPSPKEKGEV